MKLSHLLENHEDPGPITPHNVDTKYRVGKVYIDNQKGIGATPNNGNVLYMGFVAFIKPSDFLELAAPSGSRHDRAAEMQQAVNFVPIGSPFLKIYSHADKAPWGILQVSGHEGRARMTLIQKINGDEPFPVHFFPGPELRARHMDEAFFEALKHVYTEKGQRSTIELHRIFCNGKEWKI